MAVQFLGVVAVAPGGEVSFEGGDEVAGKGEIEPPRTQRDAENRQIEPQRTQRTAFSAAVPPRPLCPLWFKSCSKVHGTRRNSLDEVGERQQRGP